MFKNHILALKRSQTSQGRDLNNGLALDRNERVDYLKKKIFKKIIKNFSNHSFNINPDISILYNQIANYHKIDKKNIYITQGITECIDQLIFSFVKKDEEVIIMEPTYPMYKVLCKLNNVTYKEWKFTKDFSLNIKDLIKLITKKTKILFLVNPNLPIEYEFSGKEKKIIKKICAKKNIILVYDEAYHHFGSKSELGNCTKNKNLVVMRTFSKAWGLPGIRLGYMISNKKIVSYVSKCRSLAETNGLSMETALWALKNKHIMLDHIKDVKMGFKFISDKLNKMGQKFYGGRITNAIIIKLENLKNTENLKKYLIKNKIYIRNGFNKPIENYIRVSLCSPKKMSIFYKYFNFWKLNLYNK